MKHLYSFLLVAVSLIILVSTLAFINSKKEFRDKHLEVVLRNIGHQLLLHSKDSTSRILPVKTINERTYQISFENSFDFTPDTLMRLVQQQLAKTNMPKDYIVSVKDCNENKTAFAYEINTFTGDLKPCGGRKQEAGCYYIQIEFLAEKPFNYAWLITAFIPIAFTGFYLNRKQNKRELERRKEKENLYDEESVPGNDKRVAGTLEYKQLGKFRFYDAKGILCLNDETIELSEKEIKALSIFASNLNRVVERDRLMKEIWENEGVFVITRNVDVLVSKLRKKLSGDSSIKIINVHGKGYKFMIMDV
ncbi:MAG: helix-turn-helix domain-containing protein [Taibaiella sp.]|jgi:hypothetical protein